MVAIFREVLGATSPSLELDQVHRTLGPKPSDPDCPRDVLCQLHRYTHKELILCRAWEHGEVNFDGATIKILPDLTRATLQRKDLLRPILDLATQRGCTYRWGYPLVVTIREAMASFTLRTSTDLPALFTFLESDPVQVLDWLAILPRQMG